MRQRLAYILPTVYLIVVFTAFQAISLSSTQRDPSGALTGMPGFIWVMTLPWSFLSSHFSGSLVYLPMVVGACINAGIVYLVLRKR